MLAQLNEDEKLEGAKAMKNEADLFAYLQEVTNQEESFNIAPYNYYLVIDKNRDGTIDFSEYVLIIALGNKEDLDSRLEVVFEM